MSDPLSRLSPEELDSLRKLAKREVAAKAAERALRDELAAANALAGRVVVNRKSGRRAVILGAVTLAPRRGPVRAPRVMVELRIDGWTRSHLSPASELSNVWEMEGA